MNSPAQFLCRLPPSLTRTMSMLAAIGMLSGCAVLGIPDASTIAGSFAADSSGGEGQGVTPPALDSEAGITPVALDPEVVFDYLLADIAERRNDPATALEASARLAERTRDPDLIMRAFRRAMRGGQPDAALRMTDLMRETGADELGVGFARIQVNLVAEQPEAAQREALELLAGQPDRRETIFSNIGEVYSQQPDPGSHLPAVRQIADAYPDDPHGYFALAYVANRARDFDTLDTAITRALELAPDWEQAAVVRFVYLVQIGDRDGAAAFAEDYLERNPDALGLAERHARLLASQGELEQADRLFRRILDQQPDNSDIIMAVALVSMQREDWSGARELLQRHLGMNPDNDETRMRLALVAMERGRHEEALDWYGDVRDEALVFDAQLRMARALEEAQGGDVALEHLRGLSPASRDEEIDVILAQERVLRRMQRLDEAFELLDAAVQAIPDHGDLLYSRALLAAEFDDIRTHEQDIRRVIELEPDNAHAYNALGYTLADRTDRYEEALELITRALELAPDDPFILDSMGWVQYRLGDYQAAETYLRRALSIRSDAEIAAHLGEVLWVTGVRAEAEEIWEEALRVEPDNQTLLETLDRLKSQ